MKMLSSVGAHALNGVAHTGTLDDTQIPAAITRDTEWTAIGFVTYQAEAALSAERVANTIPNGSSTIPARTNKSANETVNNSTTYQDDDSLFTASISANENGRVIFFINYESSAVADIKFRFTGPAGMTLLTGQARGIDSTGAGFVDGNYEPATGRAFGGLGAGDRLQAVIEFGFNNGGNAGSITLQWAQATAEISDTIVYANGSSILAWVG